MSQMPSPMNPALATRPRRSTSSPRPQTGAHLSPAFPVGASRAARLGSDSRCTRGRRTRRFRQAPCPARADFFGGNSAMTMPVARPASVRPPCMESTLRSAGRPASDAGGCGAAGTNVARRRQLRRLSPLGCWCDLSAGRKLTAGRDVADARAPDMNGSPFAVGDGSWPD